MRERSHVICQGGSPPLKLVRQHIYNTYRGGSRISSYGGGAHLKKWRRAEGGAKNVGVFRVKNHDFTPKNNIFTNFKGGVPPWHITCDRSLIYKYQHNTMVVFVLGQGGTPPFKLVKIFFFGVKSWFFTRNTPTFFAPPSARRHFFKCAPPPRNLKSCIRPCMCYRYVVITDYWKVLIARMCKMCIIFIWYSGQWVLRWLGSRLKMFASNIRKLLTC
jgi:hypothetical protein